jgi:copper homeostasis protein (lipoprotein)
MKKYLLFFVFALLAGCQNQAVKKEAVSNQSHNAKNSLDYVGTYKGILPCADCNGLETEIAINENATFSIKTRYQGKGEKVYVQKGNFAWNKSGTIIILTDIKNAPNQYFVGENTLTQLNSSGQKITGNLADEYILAKQPTDTSTIETVEDNNAATVDLNNRMASTTVIQKVNPAVGKYTLAETKWKLVSLNKKGITVKGKKTYYLTLNSKDGKFLAFFGCNEISGDYVMPSSSTLSFLKIISTKMACADMTLESYFFTTLAETHSYKIDKETLTLFGADKKQLARFQATK